MTSIRMNRRSACAALAGCAASAALIRPVMAGSPTLLRAQAATVQLAPEGYPATGVWSYDGTIPGPLIRARQGDRLRRRLVNDLTVPTSIHWHGIRIDNAMDGVAGLTQEAVQPGDTFDYDFVLPDAGTYWYHAHENSMEQVGRGLSGPLIVDEPDAPDVDRDEVLVLCDWLIDPKTGGFVEPFEQGMMMSHAGRTGNLVGVNGRFDFSLRARQNERLRLRLVNTANASIFTLHLQGMAGWVVALDGMPLEAPEMAGDVITLAPAQRMDLIVDITAETGASAGLLMWIGDNDWETLASIIVDGTAARSSRDAPKPLAPNPAMDMRDFANATRLEMLMEGGAMAGFETARYQGSELDFRSLVQRGKYWSTGWSGRAEPVARDDAPCASLSRGEPVVMSIINRTAFAHAMHLHGTHFRTVAKDGSLGPLRDTVISLPDEPVEIAFNADNPGKWLFHCHMLGHAASGMSTWFEVG
ncbi:MAG: multicopper oxidase family protein [Geminicoccaceae bacterium]